MRQMIPPIAVIGAGYWGKNLVRNFAQLRALALICDANEAALQAQAALYPGVRTTTRLVDVLADEDIQAVVLATPAALHYEQVRQALLVGKHVFVEKPLALHFDQGQELVKLAAARERVLMVGHILEYHPAVAVLKDLIAQRELGELRYLYSNRLNLGKVRKEENILWSFAPHDIAVINRLVGAEPTVVAASGQSYLQPGIVDVTTTDLVFPGRVRAHIFVSWLHPYKEQKLVVIGDRKMAVFDDTVREGKLKLYDKGIDWSAGQPVVRQMPETTLAFDETEPLRLECEHFLTCIREGKQPLTDGASALRVLKVLEACQRSLESGGAPVEVAELVLSERKDGKWQVAGGKLSDAKALSLLVDHATNRPTDYSAHPTAIIDEGAVVGEGTKIWHFCHIMAGARIGRGCNLGQNVFVDNNTVIGDRVKIQNNVSVYNGVILQDDVFCGPSCVFTNVINPRSHVSRKHEFKSTLVKRGATIGANATIVCGVTLGEYSFVGAGAVITRNVPAYALVHGSPARVQGWMCACGVKLEFTSAEGGGRAVCAACGSEYVKQGEIVRPVGGDGA